MKFFKCLNSTRPDAKNLEIISTYVGCVRTPGPWLICSANGCNTSSVSLRKSRSFALAASVEDRMDDHHQRHCSAVERASLSSLQENDKVTYELETGRDGKVSASNLSLAE